MNTTALLRLYVAAAALLALLLAPGTLLAQTKTTGELPITTTSKPALALFQQARDKMDNSETTAAAPLLDEAIQKDPGFAMAYAYRAFAGGGFNVLLQNLDKAVGLVDKVSPAERLWIVAQKAQFDGNLPKAKEQVDQLLKLYPNDKRVAQLAGTILGDSPRVSPPRSATTRRPPPWTRHSLPPSTRSATRSPGSVTTRRPKRPSSSTSSCARARRIPTTPTPSSS